MNGLRLIWIISRHFKKKERMKNLIETITQEITIKVQQHIKIDKLLTKVEGIQYDKQLEEAKVKINQGRTILIKWEKEYNATKKKIEDECNDRWVSKPKAI